MSHKLFAAAVAIAALALPATAWSFKLQKPEMVDAGTITFGGDLEFSSLTTTTKVGDNESDSESTSFGIAPRIGYFVIDNLELGGELAYQSETSKPDGGDESESSAFGIGAFVHYYFRVLEGNALYPYLGARFRYISATPGEDIEVSGTSIAPGAGLMLAIGSRTGGFMKLDVAYEINSLTTKVDGVDDEAETDVSGIVVGLGFGLYLH